MFDFIANSIWWFCFSFLCFPMVLASFSVLRYVWVSFATGVPPEEFWLDKAFFDQD